MNNIEVIEKRWIKFVMYLSCSFVMYLSDNFSQRMLWSSYHTIKKGQMQVLVF